MWILYSFIVVLWLFVLYILNKFIWPYVKRVLYLSKSNDLKFLTVKIPRKESDLDQKADNIQNMKQNIEIMNQIYKNFYSIYSWNFYEKYFCQNYISLEILVEKEVIKFVLWVPSDYIETFEKTISSFIPWSVVDQISQPKILEAWKSISWWYFVLSKDTAYPIKTYENFEADPMDSLLSAFSRVNWDEKFCLQIMVSPLSEKWQKKLRKIVEKIKNWKWFSIIWAFFGLFEWLFNTDEWKDKSWWEQKNWFSSQQIQDIEKKVTDEWFDVIIRALATSPDPMRSQKIIDDLSRAFNQYNYMWLNWFVFLKANNIHKFIKDFALRLYSRPIFTLKKMLFFINVQILNIKELAAIFHFPHSRFNKNPRIRWQNFKIIPAPETIPSEWIKLWDNLYAWVKKEIFMAPKDRFRHFYIIWQTGTWKSTLLLVQAKQDVQEWRWFCMIDPHGDLCEFVIKNYPKQRIDDLIYFDASDFEMPIWFNIYEADTDEEKDIILNDSVEMFIKMYWPEIFGPRIQDYYRNWALTLMDQPEWWTMVEIVRLFVDDAYQKIKVKNVKNPVVRAWWDKTFKAMWQREKSEMIPFFQSKFWPFTTTSIIRNIIWQQKSSFNIYDAMQSGKVILLNLSKWKMWELNSQLLGTMMVTQIKLNALRRARIPENERKDYFMYIDEFQNYITPSIETILSEARKYRLWLIIAHQYIEQLVNKSLWWETDLRWAIFGNVWSMMSYKVWAKDWEYLEQEFSPEFSRSDLVNMDKFKWVMKMSVDTQPTRPFSLSVMDPYKDTLNTPDKVKIIKEISRLKWWRKKDLVEKEIYYRIWA
jgi:hypothetical protein